MNLPDPIQPGLYPDVPDAEYRKAPGVSQSSLKIMDHSAAHFSLALIQPKEPTPAMVLGRVAHQLLLTPQEPPSWVVKPEGFDGRSKEGREWTAANKGRDTLSDEDFKIISGSVEATKAHDAAAMALDGARVELSAFAQYNGGAVLRKGRFDCVPQGPAIVDFKFVADARETEFARLVADAKYYMQAAYYLDLYNAARPEGEEEKTAFVFFAVEKTPPYAVVGFNLHEDDIRRGRTEYELYLSRISAALTNNRFGIYEPPSAYKLGIKTLSLPAYTRKQLDQTILS